MAFTRYCGSWLAEARRRRIGADAMEAVASAAQTGERLARRGIADEAVRDVAPGSGTRNRAPSFRKSSPFKSRISACMGARSRAPVRYSWIAATK